MQEEHLSQNEEAIYEEEPIINIQSINIASLDNYSNRFRMSYHVIEEQLQSHTSHNLKQQQTLHFHEAIVTLIGKIQPSKLLISKTTELIKDLLGVYFPQDNKFKLRSSAKEKNILVIHKMTVEQEYQLLQEVKMSIQRISKWILLRQSQLGMVLFIEDHRKQDFKNNFRAEYQNYYKAIISQVIAPEKCMEPINYVILSKMLEYEFKLFDDFAIKTKLLDDELSIYQKKFETSKMVSKDQKYTVNNILRKLKISKLATIVQLFPYACVKPKNDLFSFQLSSDRWKKLISEGVISFKLYGESEKIDKSFDKLKNNLNIVNSAMSIMNQPNENSGLKYLQVQFQSISRVLKCAVSKTTAHNEAEIMIADPKEALAKQIWNLPQKKQLKNLIQLTLPSISFSEHIYLPRVTRSYFDAMINNQEAKLPSFLISNRDTYMKQLKIERPHRQKLSVRINCSFQLQYRQQQKQAAQQIQMNFLQKHLNKMNDKIKDGVENIKKNFKKKYQPPKAIIFHIHGGGFISMSSFIHQTYTRNWSNSLNVPIVSVDYGKAPQYPFPEGLYDCLEAYLWTINCFSQIYVSQPIKIILVGDSAGGNLVAALTDLLIQWKLRVPDGMVLVYPALNLNYYDYTPSLLTALNDMILPHTFLKICLNSYLKDPRFQPKNDYFVSPIQTPPWILRLYPPTRMFVGSKDPFHDDCCRFAEKINKQKKQNVKLTIIQQFPHGFLQFDMKNQPQYYCRQATKEVERALQDLLN